MDRQMDGQTDRWIDKQMNRQIDRDKKGKTDGQMDEIYWMDRLKDK